jgi:DNA-binding response OmpR family regulator
MRGRILVVERDCAILQLLTAVLTAEGYRVVGAADERAMRAALQRERPAVVVLDIDEAVPEVSWQMLAALRRDPRDQDLPVVVLIGQGAALDAHRSLLEGGTVVLLKPYALPALLHAVARVRALASGSRFLNPESR